MAPLDGIRKDLDARIYEKLSIWAVDSMALYKMGGLRQHDAVQDIFINLMLVLCKFAVAYNIDPDQAGKGMTETMKKLQGDLAEFVARKEQDDE